MILFLIPDLANLCVLTVNYDCIFVFTEVSSIWFCYLLLLSSWELLLPWWPCQESLREMEKSSTYVPLQHSGTRIMIGNVLNIRLLRVLIWIFILKNSKIKLRQSLLSWTIAGDETCPSAFESLSWKILGKAKCKCCDSWRSLTCKKMSEMPQGRMFSFPYGSSLYSAH